MQQRQSFTSVLLFFMGWKISYKKLMKAFVFSQVLADFPFFQITFDYFILRLPALSLGKLPLTLKVLYLVDQTFSSFLSRRPNHSILQCYKHSLMLFSFSLILSSSAEILSSKLTLHIHQRIIRSFLSSLIMSSSLIGQVVLPFSTAL